MTKPGDLTAPKALPSCSPLLPVSGWGRYPVQEARLCGDENLAVVGRYTTLSRGLGRSYGDAALPARAGGALTSTLFADRLLSFDASTGMLRAEAGCPLWRIIELFLPRGWFPPVTPGTKYVTLGGMVAADVHGKMHHSQGSFGDHVVSILLEVADGRVIECSAEQEPELFRATIGGMGLTGHILEVSFRMQKVPSPWIHEEVETVSDIRSLLSTLRAAGRDWPFTVAWADLLNTPPLFGRGAVMKGRWAQPEEAPPQPPKPRKPLRVPPVFPDWFLQPWMLRAFNRLYFYRASRATGRRIVDPDTFFYPLDALLDWNRVYGRRGFTQYQCVLPAEDGFEAHEQFVLKLRQLEAPVFLAVIKDCGAEGRGVLSFPRPGVSYAFDLPMSDRTQHIVDALNDFVIAAGGRIYLAKDALTRPEHFRAMEPRLERFLAIRRQWDPQGRFRSALSVRLFGDQP
ncbi:MAG: FAD-binding oxidoreductase [Candidatus Binatia bacterium]|nr:FAD-binding oxidoreductase [Candidatus Binatia bacterium]